MTRIVLADDHQIVRAGLRSLLENHGSVEVVGEADDGRSAIERARDTKADVVVMDVGMPGLNGVEATRSLLAEMPEVRVIALSMHSDRRYVAEMLRAGASGYLLKDAAFEELATAIDAVVSGQVYLGNGIADVVVEDYVRRLSGAHDEQVSGAAANRLSPREKEVLQLAAEGRSTKEIASCLHLSVKTVETHRRQIMEKLGIYNLAGLIKFAIREGLASLDD